MAFAFGHLVTAWVIGLLINKKKKIPQLGWGLLLLGGILPDIDFLPDWFLGTEIHRTFTHSILFIILAFVITYIILNRYKLQKQAIFISIGILIHILVDMVTMPGVQLLWPLPTWISIYGISVLKALKPVTVSLLTNKLNWAYLDMGLGVIWITYFFIKKRMKF
jgi:membrane-bound metal-dependent hydrolase YbcI (DUF457 family)